VARVDFGCHTVYIKITSNIAFKGPVEIFFRLNLLRCENLMLFMINWSVEGSNIREANERFSSGEENFYGCELIGRWHAPGNIGVLIIEANDAVSINKYMMQWDDLVDVSVTPVMDDAGALKSLEN